MKPTRAKINLLLAAAAASGLPLDVTNWMPEMITKITVKKPAIPSTIGRISPISLPIRLPAVNPFSVSSGVSGSGNGEISAVPVATGGWLPGGF